MYSKGLANTSLLLVDLVEFTY